MRHIEVEDGLRLRFPGRDESFVEGVEIGLVLARMAAGASEFTGVLGAASVEQVRSLAGRMGYRVHVVRADERQAEVTFLTGHRRPRLTLVQGSAQRAG